jgi:pimeloyl-ACP methyl ester carboxylesterase
MKQNIVFPNEYRSIWTHLFDTPHKLGFVDANGIRTRYLEAGEPGAPVVLMLHGTSGSIENFSANIRAYAENFHVYVIDMVGSGLTDKPDHDYLLPVYVDHVRAFLQAVNQTRVSLVGVSLGSWVASRFALAHPAMVERIVAVAPAGIWLDDDELRSTIAGIRERRSRAATSPSWENIKKIFDELILLPKNRIDDLIAIRWSIYQDPNMPRVMQQVLAMFDDDGWITEAEWRSLEKPLLLVTAPDHPDVYLKHANAIVKLAPDARITPIYQANHWAQFENPEAFNAVSIPFLLGQAE